MPPTNEELEAAHRAILGEVKLLQEGHQRHEMELENHAEWRGRMDQTVQRLEAAVREWRAHIPQLATKADLERLDTTPTRVILWFGGGLGIVAVSAIIALAFKH